MTKFSQPVLLVSLFMTFLPWFLNDNPETVCGKGYDPALSACLVSVFIHDLPALVPQ